MSSTEAIKAVSTLEKKSSDEFYAIVEEWKNGKFSDTVDGEYREIREKIFAEYNQIVAQILMAKNTIIEDHNRFNAHNTFSQLLEMGIIPIVNENDVISTEQIEFGDNDTLVHENRVVLVGIFGVIGVNCVSVVGRNHKTLR